MLLVTGITGYSGKYFIHQLVSQNYRYLIKCTVRKSSDTTFLDESGLLVQKIICDLGVRHALDDAMRDVNVVIHIGSIFYSRNVVESAIKNKVKRIICVHTTGIYSKFKSASSEYKKIEEEIFKLTGKNSCSGLIYLRPTMIYGHMGDRNISIFIKFIDKFRVIPLINGGKNLLQPVHGADLGLAYYRILMAKNIVNGDYILSGGNPVSMLELMKFISGYLGKDTKFVSVPLWLGILTATLLRILSFNKFDFIERVQRMSEDRSFLHEDAKKDFGYSPIRFEEGLKTTVTEYCHSRMKA